MSVQEPTRRSYLGAIELGASKAVVFICLEGLPLSIHLSIKEKEKWKAS